MKNILFLSAFIFFLLSCKKSDSNDTVPVDAEYFTFGISGGLCGNCYHYYRINGGHIYEQTGISQNGWVFSSVPMSQAKYDIALPLMNSFPSYLWAHKDTAFRCNGCADQQVFSIEIVQNGVKTYWYIDDVRSSIPSELKYYSDQMRNVISALAN
jgi:hypothetical protein